MKKCKAVFASDIDNTLTDARHLIPDEVANYITNLHNDGFTVIFLTGRTFSFAYQSLEKFEFPYLLAVQNGADLLEMPEKKICHQNYLDYSVVEALSRVYEEIGSDEFIVYAGFEKGDFCYYRKNSCSPKRLTYFEKLKKIAAAEWQEIEAWDELKGMSFPLIKCVAKERTLLALREALYEIGVTAEMSIIRDVIDTEMHLLLITHREANKGKILDQIKEKYELTSPVIAAGDDNNDIELLKRADVAIAMEDGSLELMKFATIIGKPSWEFGIMKALDEARDKLKI